MAKSKDANFLNETNKGSGEHLHNGINQSELENHSDFGINIDVPIAVLVTSSIVSGHIDDVPIDDVLPEARGSDSEEL